MQTNLNQIDVQGKKHGFWEQHHLNGKLRYSCEYVHGIPHGPWVEYLTDGSLWYKENYDMGKRIGYFIYYHYHSGMVISKRFYAN